MPEYTVIRIKCKLCPKWSPECIQIHKKEAERGIKDAITSHRTSDTLCWCCKKAVSGGCAWIDKHEPIRHWDADKTKHKEFTSYHVNDCPEFERG